MNKTNILLILILIGVIYLSVINTYTLKQEKQNKSLLLSCAKIDTIIRMGNVIVKDSDIN
jgi:hypothetical protein